MLLMGDEKGRSQHGNNNAYCQDNEISWLDWEQDTERNVAFAEFTTRLIELRRRYPMLRQSEFLHGTRALPDGTADITWLRPDGEEMTPPIGTTDSPAASACFWPRRRIVAAASGQCSRRQPSVRRSERPADFTLANARRHGSGSGQPSGSLRGRGRYVLTARSVADPSRR